MTRMEFLKQLEYLLQDIDEKDREDCDVDTLINE